MIPYQNVITLSFAWGREVKVAYIEFFSIAPPLVIALPNCRPFASFFV